jgi:hypothetical protein
MPYCFNSFNNTFSHHAMEKIIIARIKAGYNNSKTHVPTWDHLNCVFISFFILFLFRPKLHNPADEIK